MEQSKVHEDAEEERERTILIADDRMANRLGVRSALEPAGFRIVAEPITCGTAVEAAIEHRPDVCLIVTWLPGFLDLVRLIREALPETKIVLLTADGHGDELLGALRAGADGYLLMTISPERLPAAIRGVINGEAAIPRMLTSQLIEAFRQHGGGHWKMVSSDGRTVQLTGREYEVAERLRKRQPTADIAQALDISEVTVRRHVSSVLRKLVVPDRPSLVELFERTDQIPDAANVLP